MTFEDVFLLGAYFSVGYTFAHVSYNKLEEAYAEGRIVTPSWARFLLAVAVIIIWPTIPLSLTVRYVTQHWRDHV